MREVHTDDAPALEDLPISQAIVHEGTVYTSGIVPRDPETGKLLDGDMRVQAEQVMANLEAVLEVAGSSLDRVIKATVFLADVDDRPAFNEVYADHLGEPYPARSAVGVELAVETGVEMECVAAIE